MKLTSLTCLAFIVNRIIQKVPDSFISYNEVFDAAADGCLVDLLVERYGHLTDFTWLTQGHAASLEQIEAALRDAAAGFDGRVGKASTLICAPCIVLDIILEAIQQQFHPRLAPPPTPGFDFDPETQDF